MTERRFVAYYRVSTKAQGQSGLGLEAQEVAVRGFLAAEGKVLGAYTDVESGTRKGNQRPELARAVAQCRREKAILLIAKLDRLARNVHFVTGLMESGVEFVAVDMPSANRLTIHILAAVAEAEAEAISARTKAALVAAKSRGQKLGKPSNLTADVRRALTRKVGGGWHLTPPKTSRSRRTIPLPATVVQQLRGHRRAQLEERLAAGAAYVDNGIVFAGQRGQHLNEKTLGYHLKQILDRAGLRNGFRVYDLRHTCANLLLAANVNPKIVSERLGHSTVVLRLDTYSHVLPTMQRAAADQLEAMLFG